MHRTKKGVTDRYLHLWHPKYKEYTAAYCNPVISAEALLINAYRKRLSEIPDTLKANNIMSELISQPTLAGNVRDSITGTDPGLSTMNDTYNGVAGYILPSRCNEMNKTIAFSRNICFIDLAHQLPENSMYFYDVVYFTNEGCEKVRENIYSN